MEDTENNDQIEAYKNLAKRWAFWAQLFDVGELSEDFGISRLQPEERSTLFEAVNTWVQNWCENHPEEMYRIFDMLASEALGERGSRRYAAMLRDLAGVLGFAENTLGRELASRLIEESLKEGPD